MVEDINKCFVPSLQQKKQFEDIKGG